MTNPANRGVCHFMEPTAPDFEWGLDGAVL